MGDILLIVVAAGIGGYLLDRRAGHGVPLMLMSWTLVGLAAALGGWLLRDCPHGWALLVAYTLVCGYIGHWLGVKAYESTQRRRYRRAWKQLMEDRDNQNA